VCASRPEKSLPCVLVAKKTPSQLKGAVVLQNHATWREPLWLQANDPEETVLGDLGLLL
jgi:hypothetical protein